VNAVIRTRRPNEPPVNRGFSEKLLLLSQSRVSHSTFVFRYLTHRKNIEIICRRMAGEAFGHTTFDTWRYPSRSPIAVKFLYYVGSDRCEYGLGKITPRPNSLLNTVAVSLPSASQTKFSCGKFSGASSRVIPPFTNLLQNYISTQYVMSCNLKKTEKHTRDQPAKSQ